MDSKAFVSEYMKAYKNGLSLAEFARSIDYAYVTTYQRVRRYREEGVRLPELPSGLRKRDINVDDLNSIVEREK